MWDRLRFRGEHRLRWRDSQHAPLYVDRKLDVRPELVRGGLLKASGVMATEQEPSVALRLALMVTVDRC